MHKTIDAEGRKLITKRMDNLITEVYKRDNTERTYHQDTDALEWRNDQMHGCILGEYETVVVDWMGTFFREHGNTVCFRKNKADGEYKIQEFIQAGMEHAEPTKR